MRRCSFLLSVLFPLSAFAQTGTPAAAPRPAASTELAFNLGHALDNAFDGFGAGGYLRGSLSLLRSKGHFQYGFTVEGGTNSNDYWYLAPGFVANYRSSTGPSYWYGGAMAGYNVAADMIISLYPAESMFHHGYVFGLQTGYVRRLGKRLSLSGEAGLRSSQTWSRNRRDANPGMYGGARSSVTIYTPVTIGIRYSIR